MLGCKARVRLEIVRARHEPGDIELPDRVAARTERLALGRSPAGERLREPRQHNRAAAEVAQPPRVAVRSLHLELGRGVAGFEALAEQVHHVLDDTLGSMFVARFGLALLLACALGCGSSSPTGPDPDPPVTNPPVTGQIVTGTPINALTDAAAPSIAIVTNGSAL